MSGLRTFVSVAWIVFWAYWLISAFNAKSGSRSARTRPPGLFILILGAVLLRVFRTDSLQVDNTVLQVVGVIVFVSGLAMAVWARIYLGRNWGMPMTRKDEPELVTSGPYHLVRHPIYSGILLGIVGTALAVNLYWFIAAAVVGVYFVYSARVEEKLLAASFPRQYASYRATSKMLIPFVL
jgi:protein-S-isoprenylcysteine O-methyltransferase Ste14